MEDRRSEILLEMSRPDIYRINAFRCLGLPVTASEKECHSQLRKLDLMKKFEGTARVEGGILPVTPPPDDDARREAARRLSDPESRLIDELFWFWPLGLAISEDRDDALEALKDDDYYSAVSIWKRHEEQSSEANVSMHNLAIMYHVLALDLEHVEATQSLSEKQVKQKRDYWEQAFPRWQILLDHKGFWQRLTARIRELDDPRLTTETARRIREGLPFVLLSINAGLAVQAAQGGNKAEVSYHVGLMRDSGFGEGVDEVLRQAVAPMRDRVKLLCTNAESEADRAPEHGDKVASQVMEQTSQLLSTLDMLLSKSHPTREAAHDGVAVCVLKSQIGFANKTENWAVSLELLKRALRIAVGASVRQRLKENIDIVKNNSEAGAIAIEYATCWFCRKRPPKDKAAAKVKIYKVLSRTPTWSGDGFGEQVRWQQATTEVPRCARCKSAHRRRSVFQGLGSFVAILIWLGGLVGCIGMMDEDYRGALITFGICLAVGTGAFHGIRAIGRLSKGVKPEESKNEFPGLKRVKSEGWEIGEKPS